MDCYTFKALPSDEQLDYIYHHCRLIDFEIISERFHRYGMCLYHDGTLFVEVQFDGLQGDRVKEVNVYDDIQTLTRWYDPIDLKDLLSQHFEQ